MRRATIIFAFVALFLHIFVCIAEITYTESDTLLSPPNCTSDLDCMVQEKFSICEFFNITGVELEGRCVCDAGNSYYKKVDVCVFHASLGELCRPGDTVCVAPHTRCVPDGENHGKLRCRCQHGYVEVEHNSIEQCARISYSEIDPACSTCESNEGICYYTDDDAFQHRCICPEYTSGDNCQNCHVNVTCDLRRFTMVICYSPHSWFNISAGGTMLVLSNANVACKAVLATEEDQHCQSGELKLLLPLADGSRQRCYTVEIAPDVLTKKYENVIAIQKKIDYFQPGDFTFRASCAFQTHVKTKSKPLSMVGMNMDDRGLHHSAELSLLVENQLGKSLPVHIPIPIGDKIRLLISLVDDSIFTAIKVTRCLASSSPLISDLKAVTVPLLLHSCPAAEQTYLTNENNWQRISDESSRLKTGFITMFKLAQGNALHIHCAVKLCVKGFENECDPVTCETPSSHLGYGRRKRSPETKSVMVERKLIWYKKKPSKIVTVPAVRKGPILKVPVNPILIGVFAAFIVLLLLVVSAVMCKLHLCSTTKKMKLNENTDHNYQF